MLPVEIFYVKIPDLALNKAAKLKIHSWHSSSLLIPSDRLNKQEKNASVLYFPSLPTPTIEHKSFNCHITKYRNRMLRQFLTYSR